MNPAMPEKLPDPVDFDVDAGDARISGERSGSGRPIVLLHGLTATRRYVTMGSRLLERRGFDVIAYDARGHGLSGRAATPTAYEYTDLIGDLTAVLDHLGLERAVLAGSSMGAHTAMAFALEHPDRVSALVQLTPAYPGVPYEDPEGLAAWDALADGLEQDGVEGFMRAYAPQIRGRFAESIERLTRQRLERHGDPAGLAAPVRTVPRSAAFHGLEVLESLEVPTLMIGSQDEADPGHPLAVAQEYKARIPVSELVVEEPGKPPIAWRGAHLSRAIAGFLERHPS
ncbi:MAG: hypothetical protein QOG62_1660 [Thermoleophilaceae bacterium]|nr:hypothetical protein [Thermoleophilaceae bacterium]